MYDHTVTSPQNGYDDGCTAALRSSKWMTG